MTMRSYLFFIFALVVTLPAQAESINDKIDMYGQYWQRIHASTATFIRGPKAQQLLHRDIARCVVELRELERLGAVKNPIPEYMDGVVLSGPEVELAGWDAPERIEYLYAEQSDYHDFEGCMIAKGWERIKFVPYDVAYRSREDYLDAHQKYQDRNKKLFQEQTDYDHLND